MSNPDQAEIPFGHNISGYVDRRYKGSFQRIVNEREQVILAELLLRHSGRRDKYLLDLPCGYGRFLPLFRQLDYRVCAMDISPLMVEHVRSRPEFNPDDIAQTADIRSGLRLADKSISAVSCIRLFQHLHYPEWRQQALKEFARVCGGPIIVTFYDRKCLHYWTKRLLAFIRRKPVRVQMISRAAFERDVRVAGLEVVEYRAKLPRIHAQTFAVLKLPAAVRQQTA